MTVFNFEAPLFTCRFIVLVDCLSVAGKSILLHDQREAKLQSNSLFNCSSLEMRWILLASIALFSLELSCSVKVRLVGGKHKYEGRIEILYKSEWRAVCDHKWNKSGARVVCRMLGYPDVLRFTKG